MDKYNQKWPLWFKPKDSTLRSFAITIGQTCYYGCAENEVDAKWRRHEDQHKLQFKKYGIIGYSIRYCYQLLRYGYWNAPFEIEARAAAEVIK